MTVTGVKIPRTVDLSGLSGVTLDRIWLQPSGGRQALVLGPGTVIRDSDIDGSAMQIGERDGIYGNASSGSYAIEGVQITGMSVGAWLDGDASGTMTDTYIHSMASTSTTHLDGFTRRAGTGTLTIARSRVAVDYSGDGDSHATGSFFLQNTDGQPIGGVTVIDTYLEGNGYCLTLENKGQSTTVGVDNVRIRSTEWGPITASGGITYTQWTHVNLYDPSKPDAAGAVVAAQ
jgi:hypothetical protein